MHPPRHVACCRVAGLLLGTVLSAGCDGLTYVLHLAEGQGRVQGQAEPIDAVLASGRLSEEEERKLRLLVAAREFAANTMGLRVGNSYTLFYDTRGDPLAWNLSAARQDALVPRTWSFPIVGEVPYLTFFDEDYLRRYEQQVRDEGYDTLVYELDAYSTLGLFEDPVRSPMLRRDDLSLVETVIHELLHNTIWRPGDSVFSESLANFVGRQGAVEFLRAALGEESDLPAVASAVYADADAVNSFLMRLYADLEAFFAQDLTSEQKVAGREAVYQSARERFAAEVLPTLHYPEVFAFYAALPTNNAWVLANYRYNLDLDLFASVYAATGNDWSLALQTFRAAAAAPDDPFAFLRDWLAQQAPQP